jgi:hypothetical protein
MAKSILQEDKTYCFLCGANANLEPLDEHHVFNASNRKKSEKYGLKVYLHHNKCHIFGKESVHQNAEIDKNLKAYAQNQAMKHYGWNIEDFIKIFGKNYLR